MVREAKPRPTRSRWPVIDFDFRPCLVILLLGSLQQAVPWREASCLRAEGSKPFGHKRKQLWLKSTQGKVLVSNTVPFTRGYTADFNCSNHFYYLLVWPIPPSWLIFICDHFLLWTVSSFQINLTISKLSVVLADMPTPYVAPNILAWTNHLQQLWHSAGSCQEAPKASTLLQT